MRPVSILIFFQALLCFLSAYLISKISMIGRIGIALFYREYRIFRSGWKTFLLFFIIQAGIIAALSFVGKKYGRKSMLKTAYCLLAAGVLGLLLSFYDFQHTYSHRLLKERFHLGFYLFWLGWIGSCIYFLVQRPEPPASEQQTVNETAV